MKAKLVYAVNKRLLPNVGHCSHIQICIIIPIWKIVNIYNNTLQFVNSLLSGHELTMNNIFTAFIRLMIIYTYTIVHC